MEPTGIDQSQNAPSLDQAALSLLENEFNSLDGALIAVIYYDTHSLEAARETLKIIAAESTLDDISNGDSFRDPESFPDGSETDPTTLSMSSLRLSEEGWEEFGEEEADDLRELRTMFPTIRRYALKQTLDKCQGDLARATDELLNRVFLEEGNEKESFKGVDAFGEDVNGFNGSKKKRRKKKGQSQRGEIVNEGDAQNTSKWEKISRETDYLSEALGIPKAAVTSVYHKNSGALAPTVGDLLDTYGTEQDGGDVDHLDQLNRLSVEFGKEVRTEHLNLLLRMCDDKMQVFELADILRRHSTPIVALSTNKPQQPKLPAAVMRGPQLGENWTVVGTSLRPSPRSLAEDGQQHLDSSRAATIAGSYRLARNEAFEKAATSYRKSKSDKLMGGAAVFYSDLGRGYDARTKEFGNLAAEKLVSENSNDYVLDLHGVTVAQAVKIARERTTQWWVRSKDERGRGTTPYTIITGLGRHSEGGESKIFPAVSKMLVREKWNIRVQQGQITVFGVKK